MNSGIMKLLKRHQVISSTDQAEGDCGPHGKRMDTRFICRQRGPLAGGCDGKGSGNRERFW